MKTYAALALAAIVMLLVGCTDRSDINGPGQDTQGLLPSTSGFVAMSSQQITLDVDAFVTDEKSGGTYAVRGTVTCDFSKNEQEFTLVSYTSVTVSSDPDGKEYTGFIDTRGVDRGPLSSDIQVTRSYKLPGLPAGSCLTIHFRVVNEPAIEGLSIRIVRDESGIEDE